MSDVGQTRSDVHRKKVAAGCDTWAWTPTGRGSSSSTASPTGRRRASGTLGGAFWKLSSNASLHNDNRLKGEGRLHGNRDQDASARRDGRRGDHHQVAEARR